MVLTLLAVAAAILVGLGIVAVWLPPLPLRITSAVLCGVVVVLAALGLDGATSLELPIGPAGGAMHLALDPLAASFLLVLFITLPCAPVAPLVLAGTATTLLAGDGFVLGAGVLLLGSTTALRPAVIAVVCLLAALAMAGAPDALSALHTAPIDEWRAGALLLLVLAAAGSLARIDSILATYLLIRMVIDAGGTAQPQWWSGPLLVVGAGIAVIAALRAALADTVHAVLEGAALHRFGMSMLALGVAVLARAVDLPSVAARALAAAWLSVVCHAVCRTLFALCAEAIAAGAGTRRLDRLGGLIHRMPATAGFCLGALFMVAALPPGPGFAAFWLLFQALLAAVRIGDLGLQTFIAGIVGAAAFASALVVLAGVRLFGVAFLGRPRTPRAAVADEAPRPVRFVLYGLAGLGALFGLLPALAVLPATGWIGAGASVAWIGLRSGAEAPGYLPIAVAGLLAIVAIAVFYLLFRRRAHRQEALWSDGFAAPPPWLPFGDPATQFGPGSFVQPLRTALASLPAPNAFRRRIARGRRIMARAVTALLT